MRVDGASGPASRPGQGHPPPRWGDSLGRGEEGRGCSCRAGVWAGGGGVGWVWAGFARPDSLQRAPQGMSTHHRLPPPHPPTLAQPLAPHVLGGRSCRRSPRAAGQAGRRCVFGGGGGASGAGGQMLVREAECHDTASLRPGAAARQRAGWLEGACTGGRDSEPSRAGPRSRPQWHSVGRADLEEHQSLPASRAGPACWRPRPRAPPCPPLCK